MDLNEMFVPGGKKVKNPRYNNRTKKTEPEYITVADEGSGNPILDIVSKDKNANKSFEVDEQLHSDAVDYGITVTASNKDNLPVVLADRQSNWVKAGNAMIQTLGELILGTGAGISDLFDIITFNALKEDEGYGNIVGNKLTEWNEAIKKANPIYVDPEENSVTNGGLTNFGYYMSNIPSIISSLTLLIPAAGETKALSYLGRGARWSARWASGINKAEDVTKLNKFQRAVNRLTPVTGEKSAAFMTNTLEGITMRALENRQEARQVYNDLVPQLDDYLKGLKEEEYQEYKKLHAKDLEDADFDTNNRHEVAKHLATKAADRTEVLDWVNVGFDILQIYGMKNVWNGLTKKPNTFTTARQNRIHNKYFGKTEAEIKQLEKARSVWQKGKDLATDTWTGGKLAIAAEWSEGVEEAVNYIAQEEGNTLGSYYMDKIENPGESIMNPEYWSLLWNKRLYNYAKSPQLYDSALWGVIGGVAFEGLGSSFRGIQNYYEHSDERKRRKEDGKTKEQVQPTSFFDSFLNSETKARVADIKGRTQKLNTYTGRINTIGRGFNPYDIQNGQAQPIDTTNPDAVNMLKERARLEFMEDIILDAMDSGNFKFLNSFIKSDNVKQALIDAGFTTKENADQMQQDFLNLSQQLYKDYQKEASRVITTIHDINVGQLDDKQKIPDDYARLIARSNLNIKNLIKHAKEEQNYYKLKADVEKADLVEEGVLDENVDYENLAKVHSYATTLGILYDKKRKLEKKGIDRNIEENNTLRQLNEQIETLQQMIGRSGNSPMANLVNSVYAWKIANSIQSNDKGEYTIADIKSLDKEIVDTYNSLASDNEKATTKFVEKLGKQFGLNEFEAYDADVFGEQSTLLGENIFSLYGKSTGVATTIADALADKANLSEEEKVKLEKQLEIGKRYVANLEAVAKYDAVISQYKSNLSYTRSEIQNDANMLHNTFNEARRLAIQNSNATIIETTKAHKDDTNMSYLIHDVVDNNVSVEKALKNQGIKNWTQEEITRLQNALDVLNLSSKNNKALYDTIDQMLLFAEIAANSPKDTDTQNSSTTENLLSEQEKQKSNSNSSSQTKTIVEAENGQIEEIIPQEEPANEPKEITLTFDNTNALVANTAPNGKVVTRRDNNGSLLDIKLPMVPVTAQDGSTYWLINAAVENGDIDARVFNNDELFRKDLGVDYSSNNWKVESMPMLLEDGTIVAGSIVMANKEEAQQSEEEAAALNQNQQQNTTDINSVLRPDKQNIGSTQAEQTQQISSTGGLTNTDANSNTNVESQTPKPIKVQAADENIDNYVQSKDSKVKSSIMATFNEFLNTYRTGENGKVVWTVDAIRDIKAKVKEAFNNSEDKDLNSLSDEEFNTLFDKATTLFKRSYDKWIAENSPVEEMIVKQSAINENVSVTDEAFKDFGKTVDRVVEQFAKDKGLKKIGLPGEKGKYYINLEDVLRYVNKETADPIAAQFVYENIKRYLNSEAGKEKYTILDEKAANRSSFLENVSVDETERVEEQLEGLNNTRVGIAQAFDSLTDEQKVEYLTEFEKLMPGSTLTVKFNGKGFDVLSPNGKKLGFMAVPTGSLNNYSIKVNGFRFEFKTVGNRIECPARDFFIKVAEANTEEATELNAIVHKLVFDKLTNEERAELEEKFENNQLIIDARNDGLAIDTTSELLKEFKALWEFEGIAATNDTLADSIEFHFDKLKEDYDALMIISKEGKEKQVTVANIAKGDVNRTDEPHPIQEALAESSKKQVMLGVVLPGETTVYTTTDGTKVQVNGQIVGTSSILLPAGTVNGKLRVEPLHITSSKFNDDFISDKQKELNAAILNRLGELIDNYYDNPNEHYEELKNFLMSLCGKNGIFYGLSVRENTFTDKRGIKHVNLQLEIPTNINGRISDRAALSIYKPKKNTTSGNITDRRTGKKSIKLDDFKKLFEENLKISINFAAIKSDSFNDTPLNSLMKRKNGKFVISIPGHEDFVYDSYKDFLMGENLIQLNTLPEEGRDSNFKTTITTPEKRRHLEISGLHGNTPRRRNDTTQAPNTHQQAKQQAQEAATNQAETKERIIATLDASEHTDNSNDGFNIVNIVNSELANALQNVFPTQKFRNKGKEFDVLYSLLPDKIRYVDDLNDVVSGLPAGTVSFMHTESGVCYIASELADRLSSPNPDIRDRAVRVLVHEQLHYILSKPENRKYVNAVKEIFDEYRRVANSDERLNIQDFAGQYTYQNYIDIYNDTTKTQEERDKALQTAMEEFLVESLTSKTLANTLNSIKYKKSGKGTNESLLTKILSFLREAFGWSQVKNIDWNSLYAREYRILADTFSKYNKEEQRLITNPEQEASESDVLEVNDDIIIDDTIDEDFDLDSLEFSSVEEVIPYNYNQLVPSIETLSDEMPIEDSVKFNEVVQNGEREIHCV